MLRSASKFRWFIASVVALLTAGVVAIGTLPSAGADTKGAAQSFPGDVPAGSVRWGLSYNANEEPTSLENVAGRKFGGRRTFFQWNQRTTGMINTAKTDVGKGRLPWVSVKPPEGGQNDWNWKAMGDGAFDAQIDQMIDALHTVPGPVWLTVHHEPEGGGGTIKGVGDDADGSAQWVRMQQRVAARLKAKDPDNNDNIAFAPVLMDYSFRSEFKGSFRDPDKWFAPNIWDFYGIDLYSDLQAPQDNMGWPRARQWAQGKGLKIGIGELGIDPKQDWALGATHLQQWYDHVMASGTDGKGAQIIASAFFHTELNGGVPMQGAQLDKFYQLTRDKRSLLLTDQPPVTTTKPPVTTTKPPVTTTKPPVTTTKPAPKPSVVFVVGNPASLAQGDKAVAQRLSLNYSVKIVDDAARNLVKDAQAAAITIVSSSADTRVVAASKLSTVSKPVLLWEPWLYNSFGLISGGPAGVGYNGTVVRADGTPLAITSGAGTLFTGQIGGAAETKATVNGKPVLFGYAAGSTLANGQLAPACRVAYATHQDLPASFTASGWERFDTTVERARTTCNL